MKTAVQPVEPHINYSINANAPFRNLRHLNYVRFTQIEAANIHPTIISFVYVQLSLLQFKYSFNSDIEHDFNSLVVFQFSLVTHLPYTDTFDRHRVLCHGIAFLNTI